MQQCFFFILDMERHVTCNVMQLLKPLNRHIFKSKPICTKLTKKWLFNCSNYATVKVYMVYSRLVVHLLLYSFLVYSLNILSGQYRFVLLQEYQ